MNQKRSIVYVSLMLTMLFIVGTPVSGLADVPMQFSYQGELRDAAGNPIPDDTYSMVFSLYNVPSGGSSLYSESHSVPVLSGIFSVLLSGFPSSIFDADVYLGIRVGPNDSEMMPRKKLTSAPFALTSAEAENARTLEGYDASQLNQSAHVSDMENPHGVTAAQTGAATLSDIHWTNLSGVPADLADGDDVGLTVETDPSIYSDNLNYVPKWDGTALVDSSIYDDSHIGLGTIDPVRMLTVFDSSPQLRLGTSADYNWDIWAGHVFHFQKNGETKVFFDSTGRVGIGTASPSFTLDIKSPAGSDGSIKIDTTDADSGTSDTGIRFHEAGDFRGGIYIDGPSDNMAFYTGGTWATKLVVQPDGDIGIGSDSPEAKLHVQGDSGIFIANSAFTSGAYLVPDANEGLQVQNGAGRVMMQFAHSTGRVGIGTTSPFCTLDVTSRTGYDGVIKVDTTDADNGTNDAGIRFHEAGDFKGGIYNIGLDDNMEFFTGGSWATKMAIQPDGDIGIGTKTPNYTLDVRGTIGSNASLYHSDIRWKKNVSTLSDAVNKIYGLRGVQFEWRAEEFPEMAFEEGVNLGFIAQEVEEVLPEVVDTDQEGYKSVKYANIVPLLVETIKVQGAQIKALTALVCEDHPNAEICSD